MIEVFFEYNKVPLFSIELERSNTVLEMKQKIEKSYSIPVSSQTIFFKGKIIFASQDSHTLQECKIYHKSRLELYFPSKFIPNIRRVPQQTEQSPVPTKSIKEAINIEDSSEKDQDSSVVDKSKNDQVGHPTEKPPLPPCSLNPDWLEASFNPDWLESSLNPNWLVMEWSNDDHQTEKSLVPSCSIDIQESSRRNDNSQDLLQRGTSSMSNTFGSSNQVVQTEKSPQMREVINILDSPETSSNKRAKNLRVMVLPYSRVGEAVSKFQVEVNVSENVEELRIELRKMQQKSQLVLPEGGYFFIHKEKVLNEKQSFRLNRINHGDTIQIFPGSTDA